MAKKTKRNKKSEEKNKQENQTIPITLPFNKISLIKSIHNTTLNFCFLSKTNNYIIICSSSYLTLLDKNNFNVLSKYKMYEPILFLIELSNNRILLSNAKLIYLFEVDKNLRLNLLFFYEEKNFEKMGIIGLSELKNKESIISITPSYINYYKQAPNDVLELYDRFNIGTIIKLEYEDYGTQLKSAFLVEDNNDYMVLLTHQEMYIINHVTKILVKKISIEKSRSLLKYLNIEKNLTLIYHKKKLLLFDNKYLEIINEWELSNEKEEITCVEKLKKDKCLIYGTNLGKIYVYNYNETKIIKEIKFEGQIFNLAWIKELSDNIIINNLPKSEIGFSNYDNGTKLGKLNLKNSSNYRKGIYIEESKKLLLGYANNFALLE